MSVFKALNNVKAGKPPKFGLCIDFETSGSSTNPDNHAKEYQALSYGALIFDFAKFEPIDGVYSEIKFDGSNYKWDMNAEAVHGLSREHLEKNGKTKEEAACTLAELMLNYLGPSPHVWVLGHNVAYDLLFMEQLLEPFELMPSICHVKIDTSPLALMTLGVYRSNDLFDVLDLPLRDKHNALEDALLTLEAARTIRTIFQSVLNG